jgi:predicted DNA-binding protein (MmcQ/YjbR family)
MDELKILSKLREICLALPGSSETVTFGHPTFQAGKMKTFAVLERYKGELSISFKVGKSMQSVFLDDPRFFKTPYVGQHGWVSLRVNGSRLDWKEIAELAAGSHQLITGKKK